MSNEPMLPSGVMGLGDKISDLGGFNNHRCTYMPRCMFHEFSTNIFCEVQQQSGFGDENKRGDGGKAAVPAKGMYSSTSSLSMI